jgi:tetratricopeptide (TPR) repeat protein
MLEALSIFEHSLRARPSDPKRQRNAALSHKFLAGHWLGLNDLPKALPYLQRALELDEARVANSPGDQGAKLDLTFDYSQFGEYYEAKDNLPTAIEYQRKTLALRRDLAASDPRDVWKQNRLAWTLYRNAVLLIETDNYRAALADLEESTRISERLDLSDRGALDVYARTQDYRGRANRAIGKEQAACEQFSRARDLFRKLGYSPSASQGPMLEHLDKNLAPCARR